MALLTAQGISDVAIALLTRALVLPRTVTRIPGANFNGSNGDTITVRVPQPRTARTQVTPGTAITYDAASEVPVDVSLAHLYNAHQLTDEEANFELVDFGRQILMPQVVSVAIGAENELVVVMNALSAADATIVSSSIANPTVITTAAAHGFASGASVTISGHTGSTPNINGTHIITVTSATTFTIPVNVTVAGTGGTVTKIQFALAASADDTKATILEAREYLGGQDAPPGDRFAAVSSTIATRILSVPEFTKANESGSDQALRRAIIGTLFGFTFVESTALTDGTAIFYHSSGFAFANRTPTAPRSGSAQAATATEGGIGVRTILQYDPNVLSDASVVSTFAGASPVWDDVGGTLNKRFVKVGTAAS